MAIVFDVVAKACTEATSSLKFCTTCSGLDLALELQGFVLGLDAGRIYTWSVEGAVGSGFLVAWAVAMVSKSMGLLEG